MNVVTTISSKDSPKASRAPASNADRIIGNVIRTKVRNGPAPRSADACSSGRTESLQARHVVLGDDAERRARDHHGEGSRSMPSMVRERVVERDAGDDAGQRDRQDDQGARCGDRRSGSGAAPARPASRARARIAVASSATSTLTSSACRARGPAVAR